MAGKVILLAILLLFASYSSAKNTAGTLERSAKLVHGNVKTTRLLAATMHARKLIEDAEALKEQVWLIGLPSDLQQHVHASMKSMACHVLHPLPGEDDHHWIISASQRMVSKLLEAHPELTAALLPNELKMSPGLKDVLDGKGIPESELASQMQASNVQMAGTATAAVPAAEAASFKECLGKMFLVYRQLQLEFVMLAGDRIKLDVLMPHATATQVQAAMSAASKQLPQQLHQSEPNSQCKLEMEAAMHGFVMSACNQDVSTAAAWLASQRGVTWIDIHHDAKLFNLHASAAIQSGDRLQVSQPGNNEALIRQGVAGGFFPLWAAGLDGTGQIAGVVDSGFDTDSCFFYDPATPNPFTSPNNTVVSLAEYFMPNTVLPGDKPAHDAEVAKDTRISVFEDLSHRKVVQIVQYADALPEPHGTHVAGSVAGAAYGTDSLNKPLLATGAAPGARMAFYDIGPGIKSKFLKTPLFPDMIYGIQHKVGARVSCNSWGAPDFKYNPESYRFDAFTWYQQDMLLAFAAGNEGQFSNEYVSGNIGSPGNSKNVLTVGAGENWVQDTAYRGSQGGRVGIPLSGPTASFPTTDWNYLDRNYANMPYVQLLIEQATGTRTLTLNPNDKRSPVFYYPMTNAQADIPPGQSPPQGLTLLGQADLELLTQSTDYPVILVPEACQRLTRDAQPRSKIYLISKSPRACSIEVSIINAYNAGAAGVMIYFPRVQGIAFGAAPNVYSQVQSFPAVTIPDELGLDIARSIASGEAVSIRVDPPAAATTIPIENVAIFSSVGSDMSYTQKPNKPAQNRFTDLDVRIKPDVIAPGWVLSAWTDNKVSGVMDQCMATYNQGTSMATPIVTGAATIVRQYFEDGYYPTGDPKTGVPRDPSAPLVKATLIAGTAAMTGIHRATGYKLEPPPSRIQGFGRVDLSSSLPIAGGVKGWSIQVVDKINMTQVGETHTYTLTAAVSNPAKPLIVTLVWNDYPAFPGNAYILVNDLDLSVTGPDGTVHWGNNRPNGDIQNNVEKVYIAEPEAGDYTITVKAHNIYTAAGPQPYSLVALGGFTGTLDAPTA